jgi:hypothetical protein
LRRSGGFRTGKVKDQSADNDEMVTKNDEENADPTMSQVPAVRTL